MLLLLQLAFRRHIQPSARPEINFLLEYSNGPIYFLYFYPLGLHP